MVDATLQDLHAQQLTVPLAADARDTLQAQCLQDLSNGGRGIRNQIEARLLNPLARVLFDQDAQPGEHFVITAVQPGGLAVERA